MLDKDALRLIKGGKKMPNKFFQSSVILAFGKTVILFIEFLLQYTKFNIYLKQIITLFTK